jgi:hypothetical protein
MIGKLTSRSATLCTFVFPLMLGLASCQSSHSPQTTGPSQASLPGQTGQSANNDLKLVDNPSGGQFAYGSLTGQGSKADAVVYMLHKVHEHFGDKPQIGKFFQSRDGNSLATFFTLNAKTLGNKPIAGLVIVSMPGKGSPQVAVLYDYANRFVSTEPVMLRSLSAAWQTSATPSMASREQASTAARGDQEELRMTTGGDRSAVIGLPLGWHLIGVSGGQLSAEGPHGEMVGLGLIYQQIIDPRNPQARSITMMPNYSRSPHIICPLTEDLFASYVSVINQMRRNSGQSQATFNLINSTSLAPDGGPLRPLQAIFTVDLHDGIGPRRGSARIGVLALPGSPTWAMTVSNSNLPMQYADSEAAMLTAIINSYSQDRNVIAREGAADLNRIHQQAERNKILTESINERREASNQAYEAHRQELNQSEQHNAAIDWSSKLTEDYILDRSVVKDNGHDERGTVSNSFADSLVKANPDRFEIVQNQDLIRGRDY